MNSEVIILLAEDDEGHAELIRKNLGRAGVVNLIIHFKDGQEVVDFLFRLGDGPHRLSDNAYVPLGSDPAGLVLTPPDTPSSPPLPQHPSLARPSTNQQPEGG